MPLDSLMKIGLPKSNEADGRIIDPRSPVLGADRHPHRPRQLICEAVIGERGDKADRSLRDAFGRLGEGLIDVRLGAGELIEAAADPRDVPRGDGARKRGACNAPFSELAGPGDAGLAEDR